VSVIRSFIPLALTALLLSPLTAADNIVQTAVKAGNFETLVTAVKAAGLADTLQGEGPFTVFAPTDEAFANLPEGTVESLVKPENKDKLASILTYHVVAGKVPASKVVELSGAQTVNGQRVDISVNDGTVMVDGAKVVKTDIECSNGIIHVIDTVLMPADKTIPEVAKAAGQFSTLLAAVKAAELVEVLSGEGPFTVFAPTDEAFGQLPEETLNSLLKPENKGKLTAILKYHVAAGRLYSEKVVAADAVKTLEGSLVDIQAGSDGVKLNDANVAKTDIDASNGVIHVIDAVLLPPEKQANAMQTIEGAVAKGARMYNSGHHAACADLYQKTIRDLMSTKAGATYASDMRAALNTASHQHSASERAWTLRRCLDRTYTKMKRAGN
jgi:uncharacterized surface protein with fasciclin (FAS1) repeats